MRITENGWLIDKLTSKSAGLEEWGGITVDGAFIPSGGTLSTWYTGVADKGNIAPSGLLDILDPKQERMVVPVADADIPSQVTVLVQEGVLPRQMMEVLTTANVDIRPFTLENVPQPAPIPGRAYVYLLDVPPGSERREWVLNPDALIINFRSEQADNRPATLQELAAFIQVAAGMEEKTLRVGRIYRSDFQNTVIAIDTQV